MKRCECFELTPDAEGRDRSRAHEAALRTRGLVPVMPVHAALAQYAGVLGEEHLTIMLSMSAESVDVEGRLQFGFNARLGFWFEPWVKQVLLAMAGRSVHETRRVLARLARDPVAQQLAVAGSAAALLRLAAESAP